MDKLSAIRFLGRAALFGLLTLSAAPSNAQTSNVVVFPDTVVSASRVPVDRHKVGSAASVLSRQDLLDSGTTFVSNNLRDLPSMSVNRSGTFGGFTEVRIRGSESNHVLVMIDGVRVNDPALGNQFDLGRLLSFGLNRVEVLRGPQSGLYGPDALAGVISIETPDGKPGLSVETFGEYGSFNTWIGGGRVSGGVKRLTFSVFAATLDTSGTNISRSRIPGFTGEDDESSNLTVHGKIKATPFKWLQFTFAGRYQRSRLQFDSDDRPLGPFAAFTFDDGDGLSNDSNRVTKFETGSWIARVLLTFLNKRWQTEFSVSGLETDTESENNGVFNNSFQGGRLRFAGQTSYAFATPSVAKAEHRVILAVEYEKQTFNQNPVNTAGATQSRSRSRTGFVGEYRLALWDRLFLSGALRYDANQDFNNSLTYRATVAYLLRRYGTRFHGSFGRGVKNPTFLEQFGFIPGTFVGNPNLRPESSVSFDVGVEQKFFSGALVVDLTYFQAKLKDEINGFFGLGGGLFTARNVTGVSRRRGVEFVLAAQPYKGLKIKGQYSYLISQQAGTAEIRRPRHSGAISATKWLLDKRATATIAARFNGPMKDTRFGTFATGFVNQRVTIGGFVLVSLSGSYKVNKYLTVFGRVENALNQRYEEVFSFQGPRIGVFGGVRIKLDLF